MPDHNNITKKAAGGALALRQPFCMFGRGPFVRKHGSLILLEWRADDRHISQEWHAGSRHIPFMNPRAQPPRRFFDTKNAGCRETSAR
jgi:hypothetical protein